jgi:protein gp37
VGENSKIEWTHHTFNPWWGCEEVSPACEHCYARVWAARSGESNLWHGDRRRTSEANWRQPGKWDRRAAKDGVRERVFCASMADVFDNAIDPVWRRDLMRVIGCTTNLDWLLLTKRIGNGRRMLNDATAEYLGPGGWDRDPWRNVWLGATVVTQEELERDVPKLLATPAAVRFLSIEPMLEPIDLTRIQHLKMIDWIIVGGESGHGARQMHPDWVRGIRDQCAAAGIAFHFKQWGTYTEVGCALPGHPMTDAGWSIVQKKGGRILDGRTHDGLPEKP